MELGCGKGEYTVGLAKHYPNKNFIGIDIKGSRMFVELGKKVQLEKLLRGLIIQSGNDAAVALAEHVAGSETAFVQRMNEVAKELGMVNTQYQNVTGWPAADHYTTARDIVILARALITEFPDRYKLYSEKEFTYNNIKQHNRNNLLWRAYLVTPAAFRRL